MDRSFIFTGLCIILSTTVMASNGSMQPQVIYGDDNRLDLYQVSDPAILELASSTVAMIPEDKIVIGDQWSKVLTIDYKTDKGLCPDEKFYDQKTAANCTGFLVAPNKIATAGHCIQSYSDCLANKFVFGFGLTEPDTDVTTIPTNQVYSCVKVISSVYEGKGLDYALIELDRDVMDHHPLKMNLTGKIDINTPVFVIGHPSGLPTKFSDGAQVRRVNSIFFVSNLDTYGGNSGSPVFNKNTLEVEGILVRGENDFIYNGSCTVSNICTDTGCRGEDVTKASILKSFLN